MVLSVRLVSVSLFVVNAKLLTETNKCRLNQKQRHSINSLKAYTWCVVCSFYKHFSAP